MPKRRLATLGYDTYPPQSPPATNTFYYFLFQLIYWLLTSNLFLNIRKRRPPLRSRLSPTLRKLLRRTETGLREPSQTQRSMSIMPDPSSISSFIHTEYISGGKTAPLRTEVLLVLASNFSIQPFTGPVTC
jgi:hypothetical protein